MTDFDDLLARHVDNAGTAPAPAFSQLRRRAVRRRRVRALAGGALGIVVLAGAGALVIDRLGAADSVAQGVAATQAPSSSPVAERTGVVRGTVRRAALPGGRLRVIFSRPDGSSPGNADVRGGSYEAQLPTGEYSVSVDTGSDVYVATTSGVAGGCRDLVSVVGGTTTTQDLLWPCKGPIVPPPVEAGVAAGKVAPGLHAPTPQKLAHTDEFGVINSAVVEPGGGLLVQVDRVDWLSGPEAAAANDGVYPPNDYHVRNVNPATKTYLISPKAQVWGAIALSRMTEPTRSTVTALARLLTADDRTVLDSTYWHLQVDGTVVTGVEEQYHP